MKLRHVAPKHVEFKPHGYQARAIQHLCERGSAALFLDPGMGKTAITLAAFTSLQEAGIAQRMLVIAPMRVCQLVWRQEAEKWSQFKHLKFANMAGLPEKKREALLDTDADVWLINPESVPWLCHKFRGQRLPFDTLVIDELTKFKNARALRSKALHLHADKAARRWGLTGTPVPNGYMDLFGQMRMLDGGASLGRYITHYRDRYFRAGRDGFSYELREGAEKEIEAKIAPYVFRAAAEDYLTLPPLQDNIIRLQLNDEAKKVYKKMKADMLVSLEGKVVTAANAAAVYNKLQQLAGGAMYTTPPEYVKVHDVKLDALEDLVEELSGQPLLVAYAYGHELERLKQKFPNTPYLGGGVSAAEAERIEAEWNAGKIPLLFAHPASAGHGLNLQKSNAAHICWFTQTWDYEQYDQFIRRIHRQGNEATRVMNHKLLVEGTIDELVADAVEAKATTQDALLNALKCEFERDDPDAGKAFKLGEKMRKLVSPGAGGFVTSPPAAPPPAAPAPTAPHGWPPQAAAQAVPATQQTTFAVWPSIPSHETAPQETAQGPFNGFSPEIRQQLQPENAWPAATAAIDAPPEHPPETKLKRGRRPKQEPATAQAVEEEQPHGLEFSRGHTDYALVVDVGAIIQAAMAGGASHEEAFRGVGRLIDQLRGK